MKEEELQRLKDARARGEDVGEDYRGNGIPADVHLFDVDSLLELSGGFEQLIQSTEVVVVWEDLNDDFH